MKRLALLIGLLPALANAGIFTTEQVQPYPANWPTLSGMSDSCAEVQGSFVDPNTWRWAHEENPGSSLGTKNEGTREAAWQAFGLSADDVRYWDETVKSRVFKILIGADQSVTIDYLLDQKVVATRTFTKDKVSCNKDGLTITIIDRYGVVIDKLPNKGHATRHSTIYKLQGNLYVKETAMTKATVAYVWPHSSTHVNWFRCAEMVPQN
jgi:hypothetical protein